MLKEIFLRYASEKPVVQIPIIDMLQPFRATEFLDDKEQLVYHIVDNSNVIFKEK
jgi:hypothetical protein